MGRKHIIFRKSNIVLMEDLVRVMKRMEETGNARNIKSNFHYTLSYIKMCGFIYDLSSNPISCICLAPIFF